MDTKINKEDIETYINNYEGNLSFQDIYKNLVDIYSAEKNTDTYVLRKLVHSIVEKKIERLAFNNCCIYMISR